MNTRERAMAILHYQPCDRLPLFHFGFLPEALQKWTREGHLTEDEARNWTDGNEADSAIAERLGFDANWYNCFSPATGLRPPIPARVVQEFPDGSRHVLTGEGVVILQMPDAGSIPAEIDHLLKDRASWEEHFLPRLQFHPDRVEQAMVRTDAGPVRFSEGGLEYLQKGEWSEPYGLFCGSLYGAIRNWLGLVGSAYLQADDPDFFREIIDTVGNLSYEVTRYVLERGATRFDFGHFWEDICFKNGPLINPAVFRELVGPHYRRVTALLAEHGIDLVSLDCDGDIDALVPIWLENGVNIMFPIEVGTWGGSILPWRERYGKVIRGVGGMDKRVFARDRTAVDAEIERLKPMVEAGGYIPCPDHRIPGDAEWDNIRYYCDRMREEFDWS